MIPNTDQPAFHTWRWQTTKWFGEPSSTEEDWLALSEETRNSFRQGATAIYSVLNHLADKLDEVGIDTGSEHFRHGQETMLAEVKTLVRETREEIYGNVDWRTL